MVLARLLAAFNDAWQQAKKLGICVVRVVHMLRCLYSGQPLHINIDAEEDDSPIGPF